MLRIVKMWGRLQVPPGDVLKDTAKRRRKAVLKIAIGAVW